MGNGYGNVRTDRYSDMRAYDQAPPRLRWLLRNAVSSYSSRHVVEQYWTLREEVSHTMAIDRVAQAIRRGDREETLTAYGPTHPEAGGLACA